jgi:hypothetical protein
MNQWLPIPSTLTLWQSIVALPLLSSLLVLSPTLQMCILSSKSDKQFVNVLLDNITQRGTPTKLISDFAQVEISEHVQQVLQPLHITT